VLHAANKMFKCDCCVTGEGHQLLIDFKAYKEKLLHEELVIADSNNPAETLTLTFHARVLGKSVVLSTLTYTVSQKNSPVFQQP